MDQGWATVVAAIFALVFGTIVGGWVEARRSDARATADREFQERQVRSQGEREDARRREDWERADGERHRSRGVQAAEAVLDALIEVDLGPFSIGRPQAGRTSQSDPDGPSQVELEPFVVRIRRNGLAIDNPAVLQAVTWTANAINQYHVMVGNSTDGPRRVWWQIREEAEAILGAYIRGEGIPEPVTLRGYKAEIEEFYEWIDSARAVHSDEAEESATAGQP